MSDLFLPETVLRLWLLAATIIVMTVLGGILAASHAADYLAHRRGRAVQRCARGNSDIPEAPATAPAFDPVSPGSRYRIGSRLARVHQHRSSLASNAVIVGVGGVDGKQAEGAENAR